MVASSLASRTGFLPGTTSTLGPNFRRWVRPATNAIIASGSGTSSVTRSENQIESQPSDSHASTIDTNCPAPIVEAFAARRPGIDPREVMALGGHEELRERLEAFVDVGASKFVVAPIVAPTDWERELAELREHTVVPIES